MSEYEDDSTSSEESDYVSEEDLPNAGMSNVRTHKGGITLDGDNDQNIDLVEHEETPAERKESSDNGLRSRRQGRLAKIANPGANGKSKGSVVWESDGSMIWWNEDGDAGDGTIGTWEEAVYHNDIREELLAIASYDGRDSYDYPRMCGFEPFDETAFLASQKAWRGDDKRYWSTIADGILNRFESKEYKGPDVSTGWMHFGHKIVLDQDNHPVRDFSDIPATLSSAVEPWLLEAISRIDGRIVKVDFLARMPSTYTDKMGRPKTLITPAALGNKTMRFRELHGLIAWTPKAGSDPWVNYVRSKMSPWQIANNTTEGFGVFTRTAIKAAKSENEGKFLANAGSSRLPDKARRERQAKPRRRIPTKQTSRKRKRNQTELTDMELDFDATATTHQSAGASFAARS